MPTLHQYGSRSEMSGVLKDWWLHGSLRVRLDSSRLCTLLSPALHHGEPSNDVIQILRRSELCQSLPRRRFYLGHLSALQSGNGKNADNYTRVRGETGPCLLHSFGYYAPHFWDRLQVKLLLWGNRLCQISLVDLIDVWGLFRWLTVSIFQGSLHRGRLQVVTILARLLRWRQVSN